MKLCSNCSKPLARRTKGNLCNPCHAGNQFRTLARKHNPQGRSKQGGNARAKSAGQKTMDDVGPEGLASIRRRYLMGDSSAYIAREIGVSSSTIIYWLRKMGVPIRPSGGRR